MPRSESEIDQSAGPVAEFATGLRQLRRNAGNPSYRALAARTHFAPSTLSVAASGKRLPTVEVALAYVRACRGDEEDWRIRWERASSSLSTKTINAMPDTVDATAGFISAAPERSMGLLDSLRGRSEHSDPLGRTAVTAAVATIGVLIWMWRGPRRTRGGRRHAGAWSPR